MFPAHIGFVFDLHSFIILTTDRITQISDDNLECRLWEQDTLLQNEDDAGGHRWFCSFDDPGLGPVGSQQTFHGYKDKKVLGTGVEEYLFGQKIVSGGRVLVVNQGSAEVLFDTIEVAVDGIVELKDYRVYERDGADNDTDTEYSVFQTANMRAPKSRGSHNRRGLADSIGIMNTLVVRVSALDNAPPPAFDLSEDIFNDEYCLKTQYARCSYNKLTIQEYIPGTGISTVPTVVNAPGVVDVTVSVNAEGNNKEALAVLANEAIQTLFGTDKIGEMFDLVMFVSSYFFCIVLIRFDPIRSDLLVVMSLLTYNTIQN